MGCGVGTRLQGFSARATWFITCTAPSVMITPLLPSLVFHSRSRSKMSTPRDRSCSRYKSACAQFFDLRAASLSPSTVWISASVMAPVAAESAGAASAAPPAPDDDEAEPTARAAAAAAAVAAAAAAAIFSAAFCGAAGFSSAASTFFGAGSAKRRRRGVALSAVGAGAAAAAVRAAMRSSGNGLQRLTLGLVALVVASTLARC